MKKIICLLFAFVLLIGTMPVSAEENSILRSNLFDEIEFLAHEKGFLVYQIGTEIAVQNGSEYFVIYNDSVNYMENGVLLTQSIYVDGVNVKYPQKAIESFFDIDLNGKTISDAIAEATFVLEETEDYVIIKGLKEEAQELIIPGKICGKQVKIAPSAFDECKSIRKVTIREGIEEIPERCFAYAENLEEINFPKSLTVIGTCCFMGNRALESINIKNVKVIEDYAFYACNNLKSVWHNFYLETIGKHAFYRCKTLSEIDLSCVKTLKSRAFEFCNSLEKVELLSLEIWEGVKDNEVESETKRYYRGQPEGKHGGMVVYHGLDAYTNTPFKNCNNLTEVTIRYPENKTGEPFPSLFVDCPKIKSVTIENYQTSLSRWEFSNLTFDNENGYIFMGNASKDLVIYCDDWAAEEYAKLLGVKFSFLNRDIDVENSILSDDYIITIEDITGDLSTVCLDVTVFGRNSTAKQDLIKTLVWDFNVEYETESGWKRDGGLDYTDLYSFRTENSKSYRLKFDIHYRGNERSYKKVRLSSDMLSGDDKYIIVPFNKIIDGVEIPLLGQTYEGGKLVISKVSISAIVGVENPSKSIVEDISSSIQIKFKDGSIKECIEVFGKRSRSASLIFATQNPKMYEFEATANNKIVNLEEVESVIVNDIEYNLKNPQNYKNIKAE